MYHFVQTAQSNARALGESNWKVNGIKMEIFRCEHVISRHTANIDILTRNVKILCTCCFSCNRPTYNYIFYESGCTSGVQYSTTLHVTRGDIAHSLG